MNRAKQKQPLSSSDGSKNLENSPTAADSCYGTKCKKKYSCGLCKFVNTNYKRSLSKKYEEALGVLKEELNFKKTDSFSLVPSSREFFYRNTAKLAVRECEQPNSRNRYDIGLFTPGSHKVIDIRGCPVHHKRINTLLSLLKSLFETSNIKPWNDSSHSGDIKYIIFRVSSLTGKVMIIFVVSNHTCVKNIRNLMSSLSCKYLDSVWANINVSGGNRILSNKMVHMIGNLRLHDGFENLDIFVGPGSFFQVNPWVAHDIYRRIRELLGEVSKKTAVVWDFYCGVGVVSMILAECGFRVVGVEENPNATCDWTLNLKSNNLQESESQVVCAKVLDALSVPGLMPRWAKDPLAIVLNPSRSGLEKGVITKLDASLGGGFAGKIIYVSCNLKTLIRDLKEFICKNYSITKIEAFDMFAQTDKLEWLVVLSRV